MILKDFRIHFTNKLSELFPRTEIDTFFFLLIEEYLNFERIDSVLKADFEIPESKLTDLNQALKRLKKEEPIQYILGKTEFYGFPFLVDNNTLIPRPETEELVTWIVEETTKNNSLNGKKNTLLDIGTGSGCIPISLAKQLKNATIFALDIATETLKTAKKNALLNNVEITFLQVDILKKEALFNELNNQKLDIIVSNPPYVRQLEKQKMNTNVLKNEPHLALFVEDDTPLIFYDKIAEIAKIHLSENGILFFEINQYLGTEMVLLLQEKGFSNIELRKDNFGNDRVIKAYYNPEN